MPSHPGPLQGNSSFGRRQKKVVKGETQVCSPGFHRKEKAGRGKQLSLAGLNNSSGLWGRGASCPIPGPALTQGRENIGLVAENPSWLVVWDLLWIPCLQKKSIYYL